MRSIRLYLHYVSINIRCVMQYKTSFFLTAMGQFLVSFTAFLGVFFLFQRFSKVEGFTYRVLVRPQNEIIQVLGSKFELTRFGRMLQAVVMFVYGIIQSDIDWSFSKVLTVIFMLIGGTAVFTALFLIYAAFCFFTLESLEFMNIFTDGAREFGKYPVGVYGEKMLLFATFIVPYALIQYYPLLYILGRRKELIFMFLPLLACWFLIPAILFWKFGVRHYKSSGS